MKFFKFNAQLFLTPITDDSGGGGGSIINPAGPGEDPPPPASTEPQTNIRQGTSSIISMLSSTTGIPKVYIGSSLIYDESGAGEAPIFTVNVSASSNLGLSISVDGGSYTYYAPGDSLELTAGSVVTAEIEGHSIVGIIDSGTNYTRTSYEVIELEGPPGFPMEEYRFIGVYEQTSETSDTELTLDVETTFV